MAKSVLERNRAKWGVEESPSVDWYRVQGKNPRPKAIPVNLKPRLQSDLMDGAFVSSDYGNIYRTEPERCQFLLKGESGMRTGQLVGLIRHGQHHPFAYAAGHIVEDDGSHHTVRSKYIFTQSGITSARKTEQKGEVTHG